MGCGSSTKADDSPDHLPYADRHHPLTRNNHNRHHQGNRQHRYDDDEYGGDYDPASISPVWVHKMATSGVGCYDYDLPEGGGGGGKFSLNRRLLPFRRPFYSQHDFSTVTSVSDQSKIRISLSTDGSTLRIETETATASGRVGQFVSGSTSQGRQSQQGMRCPKPSPEAGAQVSVNQHHHHSCLCHDCSSNNTAGLLQTMHSPQLITTNHVEFAGTKIIVSERVPTEADNEEESDVLLRIKMAAAAKRSQYQQLRHTASSLGGVAAAGASGGNAADHDGDSVDSICQRFRQRLQQRNGSSGGSWGIPSPSMLSQTSDSTAADWLCHCNASSADSCKLKGHGQGGPLRCSCSDDVLRRMIFHDALHAAKSQAVTSSNSNSNSRQQTRSRPTNRACNDVIADSTNSKSDIDFIDVSRHSLQSPVSSMSRDEVHKQRNGHTEHSPNVENKINGDSSVSDKTDKNINGDQGSAGDGIEKGSNFNGSLPTVAAAEGLSGGFGSLGGLGERGLAFKRTVSLGTNLTSLNRVPHSATVSSLRAPLAVAYSFSSSLDDDSDDDDSDPYVNLTTIRRV